jgi:polyisoprenyl-phosphate glycosyltransferase
MKKKISFVIPVYQNARDIRRTFSAIDLLFNNALAAYSYDICFVNDGSTDGSLDEIRALSQEAAGVKYLSLSRNFGQVPAITAGMLEVTGDAVVIMSADMQDPPKLVADMVAQWESGNKIVIATRTDREDAFFAKLTSKFFYNLIKLSNPRMPAGGFDFILLDRLAADELNQIKERNRFLQGDILWLGFSVSFIPYKRNAREHGKSQWTLKKKIKYFIDGVLNTSYWPIRLASLSGMLFSVLGFLYTLLIVYQRLVNNVNPKGWAPIMVVLLIIGGLILFILGIIGEYVWRTYDETRKRKTYIVEERSDV